METYKDISCSLDERVDDLIKRMDIDELAGVLVVENFSELAQDTAVVNNYYQEQAMKNHLGIPVLTARFTGRGFEEPYPDAIGMAALIDKERVRQYSSMVSKLYRSLGIIMTDTPLIGVASNEEFLRYKDTFGMNFGLVCDYQKAYCEGMQESDKERQWGSNSVMCFGQTWPGIAVSGADHVLSYPGRNQGMQIRTFSEGVFNLCGQTKEVAGVLVDKTYTCGLGSNIFNHTLMIDTLRNQCGFSGIAATRERLLGEEVLRALELKVNMFLGNTKKEIIDACVYGIKKHGEEKLRQMLSESAAKILHKMLVTGFFDNPYVDEKAGAQVYGDVMGQLNDLGKSACEDSVILLKKSQGNSTYVVNNDWFNKVPAIENSCDTLILNLSGKDEAVEPVVSGIREANGLLPFTIYEKCNNDEHCCDVPFDKNAYNDTIDNNYLYGFGMNSCGIIDDKRVNMYNSETWDAVDEHENRLGFCVPRYMAKTMEEGMYHVIVEVYTVTKAGNILATQRAPEKTYAYCWEITGGSILKGETARQGAVRELYEETGIMAKPESLVELYRHVDAAKHGIYHSYLNIIDEEPESILLQEKETIAWRFLNKEQFFSLASSDKFSGSQRKRISMHKDEITEKIAERLM